MRHPQRWQVVTVQTRDRVDPGGKKQVCVRREAGSESRPLRLRPPSVHTHVAGRCLQNCPHPWTWLCSPWEVQLHLASAKGTSESTRCIGRPWWQSRC